MFLTAAVTFRYRGPDHQILFSTQFWPNMPLDTQSAVFKFEGTYLHCRGLLKRCISATLFAPYTGLKRKNVSYLTNIQGIPDIFSKLNQKFSST